MNRRTNVRGPDWRRARSGHECNYPECTEVVSKGLWGCREHFLLLPVTLRDRYMQTRAKAREKVKTEINQWLAKQGVV